MLLSVEVGLLTATILIAAASFLLSLYTVRKARWIIAAIDRQGRRSDHQFRHLFRHVQIIQALQTDLKLPNSLPPTGGKAGSPDFLKAVADHARSAKPKLVVECESGISTVAIARCLQLNGGGHVYSMEHMPQFAEMTRAELERQGLSDWATVLQAPLVPQELSGKLFQWYQTDGLPNESIDLLIVDGPPARTGTDPRYPAGPRLFPRLSARGAVFIDDAGRPEELGVIEEWRMGFRHLTFEVNTEDFQKGLCFARPARQEAARADRAAA